MALDLALSDAVWKRFNRENGYYLRILRTLEETARRFELEREQLINIDDFNGNFTTPFSANVMTGWKYGVNCTEAGFVFVRTVANGGDWDIHLYKAAGGGGGNEIASSTAVADGATATMTEVNSSGVSGALRLSAAVVGEIDDVHRIQVLLDWRSELKTLFPSDGTTNDDVDSHDSAVAMLNRIASQIRATLVTARAGLSAWAFDRGTNFLQSGDTTLWNEGRDNDGGAVTRPVTGMISTMSRSWEKNTTGSEQDIIERVVTGAAASFDSGNAGTGVIASHSPDERTPAPATIRIKCSHGLGTGGGGV